MINDVVYDYRRITERKPCFLACGFILLNGILYSVGVEDASLSGVGMITHKPLPVNSYAKVAINTRKKGLILVEGKICWSKKTDRGWRSGMVFNKKLCFAPTVIS